MTKLKQRLCDTSVDATARASFYFGDGSQRMLPHKSFVLFLVTFVAIWLLLASTLWDGALSTGRIFDDVDSGYQTHLEISHYWGQYSPFFSVPSNISAAIPEDCSLTFVNVLSRHGARYPTLGKTMMYGITMSKIKRSSSFKGVYAFLKDYKYELGSDDLTKFGRQEMVNSGSKFYTRYESLAKDFDIFVRAASQERVVQSAQKFASGYHSAKLQDDKAKHDDYPYKIVLLTEGPDYNNTLSNDMCFNFRHDPAYSNVGNNAQTEFAATFIPALTRRLNQNLPGAMLDEVDTINIMDLCPFNTVYTGSMSPFCRLFTEAEWRLYDYFQSLGKYYGFGPGNTLASTQGVGFVNEVIARLTNSPVEDHTSVNHTMDSSHETFPIGKDNKIFADFSHDNDMTTIFAALGLYNATKPLSTEQLESPSETNGYAASWSVPFAGRAYIEKMSCGSSRHELVRVLVNDRVIPLEFCGGDDLGRCTLPQFVESLAFAKMGGHWDWC